MKTLSKQNTNTTGIANSFIEHLREPGEKIRREVRPPTSKEQNYEFYKMSLNENSIFPCVVQEHRTHDTLNNKIINMFYSSIIKHLSLMSQ